MNVTSCGVPASARLSELHYPEPFFRESALVYRERGALIPACGSGRSRKLSVQKVRIESRQCTAGTEQVSEDVAYLHRTLDQLNRPHFASALGTDQWFALIWVQRPFMRKE